MKRASAVVCAAVLFFAAAISAQNSTPTPKPGPEHKRLAYFVGNWTTESEMKPGPFGPGGKVSSKDHAQLMPGGFFVVTHSEWTGVMGDGTELSVMGYNAEERTYTYNAFNSAGEVEESKGTVEGDTWTWTGAEKWGGKVTNTRFIVKELSPTSYWFKFEMRPEAGEWSTIMEGKSTKAQ